MSAIGGKADVRELPAVCPLIARSGHSRILDIGGVSLEIGYGRGSVQKVIVWPEEWTFEESLSASYGFVPIEATDKSLTFLRSEDGLDVYRNAMTGKEVFVGRSGREPRIHPHFTARLTDT